MTADQLACLEDRCGYLGDRIKAKRKRNWEFAYDERERDALAAALLEIARSKVKRRAEPEADVMNGRYRVFSPEVRAATQRRIARAEKSVTVKQHRHRRPVNVEE